MECECRFAACESRWRDFTATNDDLRQRLNVGIGLTDELGYSVVRLFFIRKRPLSPYSAHESLPNSIIDRQRSSADKISSGNADMVEPEKPRGNDRPSAYKR